MLCINKTCPPRNVQDEIDRVRRTPEWCEANDPEQIRDCFDQLDKNAIREALIREQHSLCAYCMRRIYNDNYRALDSFIDTQNCLADVDTQIAEIIKEAINANT